jgi:hypothetical protein
MMTINTYNEFSPDENPSGDIYTFRLSEGDRHFDIVFYSLDWRFASLDSRMDWFRRTRDKVEDWLLSLDGDISEAEKNWVKLLEREIIKIRFT